MILYFHAKLSELRVTHHEFFRIAYEWKFHKQVDLTGDCVRIPDAKRTAQVRA